MNNTPSALIVDDDVMFSEGVQHYLALREMQAYHVRNASEMFEEISSVPYPLILLDWHLRDESNTIELAAKLCRQHKVLIVSDSASRYQQRLALEVGSHGYLDKAYPLQRLHQAICTILGGGSDFPDVMPPNSFQYHSRPLPALKKHEIQMLICFMCQPKSPYKKMAESLSLSEAWLKECMVSLYRKFKVNSSEQMFLALQKYGLLPVITPRMAALSLQQAGIQDALLIWEQGAVVNQH